MAGGVAGTIAWGSGIPFDVVKTRHQAQQGLPGEERRFWPTLRAIARTEGVARLFTGTGPLLSRAFVVNAATFYGYEEALRAINGPLAA